LDGPIYHNAEDIRGGDVYATRKMIPRREIGPDGADHILKETASLNNGNGSPHEGDGASKKNHGTQPHLKKKIVSTKAVRGRNGNVQ
jgi:hypothetical protein